ncbi:MAG: TetR/AcrR family transcriptional regulator [Verrucomicrobiaceae bacterium]|nr:MAG: TetR/AcrR family transcriptional regulator [Verrucomicrobiaceae bacterium]
MEMDSRTKMQKVKRQRNQRGEGTRLKSEFVEAAMRILDRNPTSPLSLRMVAKEAGVTAPAVYMQFPDAAAMLKEVVHECWRQMANDMRHALKVSGECSPLETLLTSAQAYVRYAMERPSRYHLLFDMPGVSAMDPVGPVRPVFRVIAEPIEQMAINNEPVPLSDPILAALLVLSIAHGRIALAHTAPVRPENSTDFVENFVRISVEQIFEDRKIASAL